MLIMVIVNDINDSYTKGYYYYWFFFVAFHKHLLLPSFYVVVFLYFILYFVPVSICLCWYKDNKII